MKGVVVVAFMGSCGPPALENFISRGPGERWWYRVNGKGDVFKLSCDTSHPSLYQFGR